jgi:hypothetical protein
MAKLLPLAQRVESAREDVMAAAPVVKPGRISFNFDLEGAEESPGESAAPASQT